MKSCGKCRLLKPLDAFVRDKTRPSGRYSLCKSCSYLARQKTKDKKSAYDKAYRNRNKNKLRAYRRKLTDQNLDFRLKRRLRARIYKALAGNYRSGSAVRDLGCSIPELKLHLERQFQEGMSWDNWGRTGWHIDHIMPLASFNLSNPGQFRQACHHTNLQPLWHKDNARKGART